MTDRPAFAGGDSSPLLRTLAFGFVCAASACGDTSGPAPDADASDTPVDTAAEVDLDVEPTDLPDLADSRNGVEVDTFRCTSDPECVPVIGAIDLCERAACNTLTGQCVRTAQVDGTPCSDRNACTPNDTCRSARCVGLGVTDCDDRNPCTADRCEPREGCLHAPVDGSCDDDNRCTERDRCADGLCVGAPTDCDDDDPCTLDRCDKDLGCIYRTVDPCPSGDPG